jgi:hypothetical protein
MNGYRLRDVFSFSFHEEFHRESQTVVAVVLQQKPSGSLFFLSLSRCCVRDKSSIIKKKKIIDRPQSSFWLNALLVLVTSSLNFFLEFKVSSLRIKSAYGGLLFSFRSDKHKNTQAQAAVAAAAAAAAAVRQS